MPDRELLITLDRARSGLRTQIEEQLRAAIREQRLRPDAALPSTRALARELGVSRGVIVEAYAQLAAEGYVATHQGGSTRVARAEAESIGPAAPAVDERPPRYDLRPGGPDVSLFPRSAWLASLRRGLRGAPDSRLDYGDPRGAPELRAALAGYLGRVRGVATEPDHVVVTSGMAQGMALFGRALVTRGQTHIAVEDPWSGPGREQLASTGLEPVPVPVDQHGLRADLLPPAGSVAVTPAHQFPLGVVLAPERRARLVAWTQRTGAFVLEDDYDAEYRYDRQPVGAVQGLAPDRVVYAGSVSKTLAPGLRVGWLAAPDALLEEITDAKAADDLGTPVLDQLALADFLDRGELDRHLRRTRAVYRARRDALVESLGRRLPGCRVGGVAAGLHLVVWLPDGTYERAVLEAARARGIALQGLAEHALRPQPPALLVGYGRIAEPAIDAGVAELAAAIRRPRRR